MQRGEIAVCVREGVTGLNALHEVSAGEVAQNTELCLWDL